MQIPVESQKFKEKPRRGAAPLMAGLILAFTLLAALSPSMIGRAGPEAQIPTGSIPTVTGTPVGSVVVVLDNEQGFVNLRAGPSTVGFEIIGMITAGTTVPALGRTRGGDWILVSYPGSAQGVGWLWSDLVDVRGTLPVVEPPPTPTPLVTATIDPTLAAQFLVEIPPTRLPTFTPPPPFIQPTMPSDAPGASGGRVPMGMIIIGMAVIGLVGAFVSFLASR